MAYWDFNDLSRRTASDKILRDERSFNIEKVSTYDEYQRELASMVYKFFDKKSKGSGVTTLVSIALENSKQLTKELHKQIIRKIKQRTVYSEFKDNMWGADLADMLLISNFNKVFRFLLCVIHIVPLKDRKGVSIVDAFQKIVEESNRKPNKIWVGKGSKFYNNSFWKMVKR